MHRTSMKTFAARLSVVAVAVAALNLALPGAASAAPARQNTTTRPLLLIHGYSNTANTDCVGTWSAVKQHYPAWGWTGAIRSLGYYGGGNQCDVRFARVGGGGGTTGLSIESLGYDLAWWIYNNYSRHGIAVDVLAYSMGGLVTRSAINGYHNHWAGWPPLLYVEDVATLGTPHLGSGWFANTFCTSLQCQQMRPGSAYLNPSRLSTNPQSGMGTDWTTMGSDEDNIIPMNSAADGMPQAGHRIRYLGDADIEHGSWLNANPNGINFHCEFWNFYDPRYINHPAGSSPIRAAFNAVRYGVGTSSW
jgi:hypothetical protein